MIAKLLALVLCLSSFAQAAVYKDTIQTAANILDTYIKGGTEALKNYGSSVSAEVNKNTRVLIKANNIASYVPAGRKVLACTLFVTSGNDVQNTHAGTLSAYEVKKPWVEGNGWYREGALWDYYYAPLYPDTVPQASLPSAFSWVDSSLDGDAKNQLSCGSCYAFGGYAAMEDAYAIQHGERLLSYNSGDEIGSDRSGTLYDSIPITSTGWKVIKLPNQSFVSAYTHDSLNCGWPILWSTGEYTITTSEALARGANDHRPRIYGIYQRDSSGISDEPSKDNFGTSLVMETVLKGGTDSLTNFGADTAITLNSTNPIMLLRLENIKQLYGNYVIGWSQQYCSLYVQAKVTNGKSWTSRALKKWVEDQATYTEWKTGYGWGTHGTLKSAFLDLSEQFSLNCDPNSGCNGGYAPNCVDYSIANGVIEEFNYPYSGSDTLSCLDTTGLTRNYVTWWWPVNVSTQNKLKQAIMQRPVSYTEKIYDNYSSFTGSGVFVGTGTPQEIGHQVLIVGWDDSKTYSGGTGAWLVRNSWSQTWGYLGRAWTCYNGNTPIYPWPFSGNTSTEFIVETIQTPKSWANSGMLGTQDFNETAAGSVSVTTTAAVEYKIPINVDLAKQWYRGEQNYGVAVRPTIGTGLDSAEIYIGLCESSGQGRPPAPNRPYFVFYTTDAVTKLGNVKIGNTKVGR